MPRDLEALINEDVLQGMPPLNPQEQGSSQTSGDRGSRGIDGDDEPSKQRQKRRDDLHPYTQTLTESDVESCARLEEATFPPDERCTREKFRYRFKQCGELCLGIFTSQQDSAVPTAAVAAPVSSDVPERRAILLGHLVATKSTEPVVTDAAMAYPTPSNPNPALGHQEAGRTLCIHSLAVLPEFQNCGLGSTLIKEYLHRVEANDLADRVALLAHDHMVPYYEKLGFTNQGKSKATFGGGGWYDMVKGFN